ncbi:MAG: DUF4377 domain-containing protein [Chitinophagales bacterium]
MKKKHNILFFLLTILYTAKIFSTPPPPSPTIPPTTLIVKGFVPCNKNNTGKCLEVKVVENNKTEIITGIKNFTYDNNYIYTITVKQINEPDYKYSWKETIKIERKPEDITLTVLQSTPCSDNSNEECLLVKRLDKSKTEIVRIKGFDYDKCYTYTLSVKESNESNYKYILKKTVDKKKKSECDNPEYTIIIEKDGFDVENNVKYRVEGTNDTIQFPIDHFRGINFIKDTRYVLKVKEVIEKDQTFLELIEQLEPKPTSPNFDTLIILSQTVPCSNNPNIQCLQIQKFRNNNIEKVSNIKNFKHTKGNKYTIQAQKTNSNEYTCIKILNTEPETETHISFYNCYGEEKRIQTNNDVIYTRYYINSDNSIDIRPVDYVTQEFYKFYGNICNFTFHEDHKYVLEVKRDGNDYILIKELCDTIMNYISNPSKKIYLPCVNIGQQNNPPKPDNINNSTRDSVQSKPYKKPPPNFKPKSIDSAIWYLRYLFQTDSLQPINDLTDTSYFFDTDISLDKINITTPCETYADKLRSYEKNSFKYESRTISGKRCDPTTKLLFEQLKQVNHYEIEDNKLKISFNDNTTQDAKVLIIFEGFPK